MPGLRMTGDQLAKSGSEHGEQRAFFAELRYWSEAVEDMTFAIPNGGSRGDTEKSRMIRGNALKSEGVKKGVPDVMVAWPLFYDDGTWFAGLYVELKRDADREKDRKAGVLGKAQEPWHIKLRARGYAVAVAYNWREALAAVKLYFRAA